MSYGEALDRLQYLLSDDEILMDNYFRETQLQTARQRFIGVRIGNEPQEQVLSEEEVAHGHKFLFPLHVLVTTGCNRMRTLRRCWANISVRC